MNLSDLDKVMRTILGGLAPGVELSTAQLKDEVCKRSDVDPLDKGIYDMIKKLAPKFQDSWKHGAARKVGANSGFAKVWHRPLTKRCPHCNGIL